MAKKKNSTAPGKGRIKGQGSRYDRIVVVGIVVALVAIGLMLWGPLKKFQFKGEKAAQQAQKKQRCGRNKPRTKDREKRKRRTRPKERKDRR